MRKMVMELVPGKKFATFMRSFFDKIESIELIEILKLDVEKGVKMVISEITTKDGYKLDDVRLPSWVRILHVIKQEGNKYFCLAKSEIPGSMFDRFGISDIKTVVSAHSRMNVIWTAPTFANQDKMVLSCIGENEDLKNNLELIKNFFVIKKVSFHPATFRERDVLSCLTKKQRDVLVAAEKLGYYEYPRRLNAEELSDRLDLSKSTVIEHLRKAETRIMSAILTGYTE